jgi:hypothetical protein
MANIKYRDYRDQEIYVKGAGAGTDADPAVVAVSLSAGTATTDVAAGANDVGIPVLAKRVDYGSVTTIAPANGDYARLQVDELGRLHVAIGPYDPISRIPVVLDFDHHQIHEGEAWQWSWYGAVNTTTKNVKIVVPNVTATTRTPHLLTEVVSDASALVYLHEDATFTSEGTEDTAVYNRNRNVLGSAGTKIYTAGATALTVNSTGTKLWTGMLIAASKASLAADRALSEWDLKSNTVYLMQVVTGQATNVLIRLNWYEDLGV